jgi:hypothetical protein
MSARDELLLYRSAIPGTLGGHRGMKIYGRLDCPAALRAIARGGYANKRGLLRRRRRRDSREQEA